MYPLISVIVPVYKVEQYLSKCIDSIINQTYKNLEIILVDDGSPDKCGKICDEYAIKDSRIIVIHKKNGGLSSARNAALDICKGKYIMFVDSDDYVETNFCESALNIIQEKDVLCISFGYYEIRGNVRKKLVTQNPRILSAEEAIEKIIKLDDVIYSLAWNKIFHRTLFESIRFPEGRTYEDQGTTYKLFDIAGRIYVSNLALYDYFRREDSITGFPTSFSSFNDKFDLWHERLLFLYNHYPKLVAAEHQQILELVQTGLVTFPWSKHKELIRKFKQYLDTYKKDIIKLGLNGRLISLYYYCYPLFFLRVSLHRLSQ